MASGEGEQWDAEKMLDLYIHDYMVKKNMHETSEIFAKEANVCHSVVIDSPEGFLTEWWMMFWDIYSSRLSKHPEAKEESSNKTKQMMPNEIQNFCPILPKPDVHQQRTGQDFGKMMGQPAAGLLAAKIYEEEHLRHPTRDLNPNIQLLDVDKLAHSKPSSSNASHTQQQISKKAQPWVVRDNTRGISLGKSLPMDSALYGVPKGVFPRTGLHDAGMDNGVNPIPLKGWPINGVDQIPPGLGYQVLNSLTPVPNQQQKFQTPAAHHQQDLSAQVMAETPGKPTSSFPGITSSLGSIRLTGSELSGKDGQMMVPMQQMAEQQTMVPARERVQQPRDQLKQHQLHENSRKREHLSFSHAGENASEGKDAEADKALDENVESFLSHGDDNADITSTSFSTWQQHSSACNKNEHKGFSFEEVGCLHSTKNKILCCHFSSEGKLLASAGHEKKVFIWRMDTYDFVNTVEGHSHLITDVRFRPSSTIFATSSFDRTVQIWDAAKCQSLVSVTSVATLYIYFKYVQTHKSLFKLLGHAEQVTSLDFHPRKTDLLCSCDSNEEIRLWNIHQCACTRISKGATRQVRFQPRVGNLLAAAAKNGISLIDVETNSLQYYLEGHVKEVRSISWDTSGKYIATVSEDSARVWSIGSGGKCIHELHSGGNKFESCTFHPGYSQLLVIGCYQSLELWNPTESNKTLTVAAHNGMIAALADSPETEIIASASHDQLVKLWK